MILFGIAGLAGLGIALVTPSAADKAGDFLDGRISEDEFLDSYGGVAALQIVQGVITLAAAVCTIIWLYRLASNVRTFGRQTTWAPIWAVFGWVLPPVLVIIPLLMLREVWKASDPEVPAGNPNWKSGAENPMLFVWFVLYGIVPAVITAITLNSAFGGGFGGDTESVAEAIEDFGAVDIVGAVSGLAAAVVWIIVVKQMTARHVRLTNER